MHTCQIFPQKMHPPSRTRVYCCDCEMRYMRWGDFESSFILFFQLCTSIITDASRHSSELQDRRYPSPIPGYPPSPCSSGGTHTASAVLHYVTEDDVTFLTARFQFQSLAQNCSICGMVPAVTWEVDSRGGIFVPSVFVLVVL